MVSSEELSSFTKCRFANLPDCVSSEFLRGYTTGFFKIDKPVKDAQENMDKKRPKASLTLDLGSYEMAQRAVQEMNDALVCGKRISVSMFVPGYIDSNMKKVYVRHRESAKTAFEVFEALRSFGTIVSIRSHYKDDSNSYPSYFHVSFLDKEQARNVIAHESSLRPDLFVAQPKLRTANTPASNKSVPKIKKEGKGKKPLDPVLVDVYQVPERSKSSVTMVHFADQAHTTDDDSENQDYLLYKDLLAKVEERRLTKEGKELYQKLHVDSIGDDAAVDSIHDKLYDHPLISGDPDRNKILDLIVNSFHIHDLLNMCKDEECGDNKLLSSALKFMKSMLESNRTKISDREIKAYWFGWHLGLDFMISDEHRKEVVCERILSALKADPSRELPSKEHVDVILASFTVQQLLELLVDVRVCNIYLRLAKKAINAGEKKIRHFSMEMVDLLLDLKCDLLATDWEDALYCYLSDKYKDTFNVQKPNVVLDMLFRSLSFEELTEIALTKESFQAWMQYAELSICHGLIRLPDTAKDLMRRFFELRLEECQSDDMRKNHIRKLFPESTENATPSEKLIDILCNSLHVYELLEVAMDQEKCKVYEEYARRANISGIEILSDSDKKSARLFIRLNLHLFPEDNSRKQQIRDHMKKCYGNTYIHVKLIDVLSEAMDVYELIGVAANFDEWLAYFSYADDYPRSHYGFSPELTSYDIALFRKLGLNSMPSVAKQKSALSIHLSNVYGNTVKEHSKDKIFTIFVNSFHVRELIKIYPDKKLSNFYLKYAHEAFVLGRTSFQRPLYTIKELHVKLDLDSLPSDVRRIEVIRDYMHRTLNASPLDPVFSDEDWLKLCKLYEVDELLEIAADRASFVSLKEQWRSYSPYSPPTRILSVAALRLGKSLGSDSWKASSPLGKAEKLSLICRIREERKHFPQEFKLKQLENIITIFENSLNDHDLLEIAVNSERFDMYARDAMVMMDNVRQCAIKDLRIPQFSEKAIRLRIALCLDKLHTTVAKKKAIHGYLCRKYTDQYTKDALEKAVSSLLVSKDLVSLLNLIVDEKLLLPHFNPPESRFSRALASLVYYVPSLSRNPSTK